MVLNSKFTKELWRGFKYISPSNPFPEPLSSLSSQHLHTSFVNFYSQQNTSISIDTHGWNFLNSLRLHTRGSLNSSQELRVTGLLESLEPAIVSSGFLPAPLINQLRVTGAWINVAVLRGHCKDTQNTRKEIIKDFLFNTRLPSVKVRYYIKLERIHHSTRTAQPGFG